MCVCFVTDRERESCLVRLKAEDLTETTFGGQLFFAGLVSFGPIPSKYYPSIIVNKLLAIGNKKTTKPKNRMRKSTLLRLKKILATCKNIQKKTCLQIESRKKNSINKNLLESFTTFLLVPESGLPFIDFLLFTLYIVYSYLLVFCVDLAR